MSLMLSHNNGTALSCLVGFSTPDCITSQGIWKYLARLFGCHNDVGHYWHLVGKGQEYYTSEMVGLPFTVNLPQSQCSGTLPQETSTNPCPQNI